MAVGWGNALKLGNLQLTPANSGKQGFFLAPALLLAAVLLEVLRGIKAGEGSVCGVVDDWMVRCRSMKSHVTPFLVKCNGSKSC